MWQVISHCVDARPCNDFVVLRRVRNCLCIIIIIISVFLPKSYKASLFFWCNKLVFQQNLYGMLQNKLDYVTFSWVHENLYWIMPITLSLVAQTWRQISNIFKYCAIINILCHITSDIAEENVKMHPLTSDDLALIYLCFANWKKHKVLRMMKELLSKQWKCSKLNDLIKRIDKTGNTDRKQSSGQTICS